MGLTIIGLEINYVDWDMRIFHKNAGVMKMKATLEWWTREGQQGEGPGLVRAWQPLRCRGSICQTFEHVGPSARELRLLATLSWQ